MPAERIEETHYIHEGRGRPIILVHGILGSLHQWEALVPELVAAGYEVYAPDLLGHGDSPRPADPSGYHADSVYEHFESWLDSLQLSAPPILAGHSLGAYISLGYALNGRKEIAGLFFSNPYFSQEQLARGVQLSLENIDFSKAVLRHAPHWTIRSALRLSASNDEYLPRRIRDRLARDYKKLDPEILEVARTTRDMYSDLDRVWQPTMIVWGERDQTLLPETFPDLCELVPHADRRTLPGGHNPHLTHPEAFNNSVLEFAARVDRTRDPAA